MPCPLRFQKVLPQAPSCPVFLFHEKLQDQLLKDACNSYLSVCGHLFRLIICYNHSGYVSTEEIHNESRSVSDISQSTPVMKGENRMSKKNNKFQGGVFPMPPMPFAPWGMPGSRNSAEEEGEKNAQKENIKSTVKSVWTQESRSTLRRIN